MNFINEDDMMDGVDNTLNTYKSRTMAEGQSGYNKISNILGYANMFDKVVVGGDVFDYFSKGNLELTNRLFTERSVDGKISMTLGNHEYMETMNGATPNYTMDYKYEQIQSVWTNNIYYASEIMKDANGNDKLMLIYLDNGDHHYWDCQVEPLTNDLAYAKANNIPVIIFQHIPMLTMNENETEYPIIDAAGDWHGLWDMATHFGTEENHTAYRDMTSSASGYIGIEYDNQGNELDNATNAVIKLIRSNYSTVKAVFTGHEHANMYTEIVGIDENGDGFEKIKDVFFVNNQELIELLNSMSIEEKIGEMQQIPGEYYTQDIEATGENNCLIFNEETVKNVGSTLNVTDPKLILDIQKKHIENHPHKIPMLFMRDIIHGFHTTFPIPLAQGCSFDDELVKKIASATAKEASASGIHVTFSPMVDLVRDARWGRVMEAYGEDPYLISRMAKATVDGYQGDNLSKEDTICSCVKHFAGYGAVEGGREYGTVDISERNLRNDYLKGYKSACDAKCGMLMTAFNTISGIPCTANKHLLKDILRDEWKYDGAVITDYGSLNNMVSHGISDSDEELSKLAIDSTVDIEMCINRYEKGLPKLIADKKITMSQIDEAVYRILKLKNRLGLFENPYRYANVQKSQSINRSKEMLDTALDSVSKTSVLLKNDNNILPLNEKEKIAFIGPFLSAEDMLGGWVVFRDYKDTTIEEEIKNTYKDADFSFSKGCEIIGCEQTERHFCNIKNYEDNSADRKRKIDDAVDCAKNADKVVMFLGEHPRVGGELKSKIDITVPQIQQELFREIARVNDNIIVVLFNHRPLDLREISQKSKAILDVWFPGTMAAKGITQMLFGDTAPTGKLSMSFPYSVGQCPIYYNMLPTDHSPEYVDYFVTGYCDAPITPLYPFGYGLTYTNFKYSKPKTDKDTISKEESITISVDVTNMGDIAGVETVQLYIRDLFASVSRPVRELKGYKKIFLKAGETKTVEFSITNNDLKFYDVNMSFVSESGEFRAFVGGDSTTSNEISFFLK